VLSRFSQALILSVAALLALASGVAGQIQFPADAGLIDVRAHGAKGDGQTDDTRAIQAVFDRFDGGGAVIYFPAGTYLISDTIQWRGRQTNNILQGQGQDHTIIRLIDNAPLFQNAQKPRNLFYTGGAPAQRFRNAVRDVTIDVGRGNPGAVGLNFCANNQGVVREVTIRSGADGSEAGAVGLALDQGEVGPLLVKNVTIIGFDTGIRVRGSVNSVTLEHITLSGQRKAGIDNHNNLVFLRKLISRNAVSAVVNGGPDGVFLLIDSDLRGHGDAAGQPAIRMEHERAAAFVRNVTTDGYASAIRDHAGQTIAGGRIDEWVSQAPVSLFPGELRSLNLPVVETPEVPFGDVSKWVNVQDFGALPQDARDDTAAIQKAIDSGAETIYFPRGVQLPPQQRGGNPGWRGAYTISDTIRIRGNVKRLVGFEATFFFQPKDGQPQDQPVFLFEDGAAPVVVVERLMFMIGNYFPNPAFVHAAKRDLVLSSFTGARAVIHQGSGRLFVDDVVGSQPRKLQPGSRLYARQLNIEGEHTEEPKLINTGGAAWVLGFKTEHRSPALGTYDGGVSEILGAHFYTCVNGSQDKVLLDVRDATAIVAGAGEYAWSYSWATDTVLRATRQGQTRTLPKAPLVRRAGGSMLPLIVSRPAPATGTPPPPPRVTLAAQTAASVTLALQGDDAVGYRIERDGQLVGLRGGSFRDTGLAPSTSYHYQVSAYNRFGGVSSPVSLSVQTPADTVAPTAPAELSTAQLTHRRVHLRWKPSEDELGIAGYRVERIEGDRAVVLEEETTKLDRLDAAVDRGAQLTYRVTAFDAAGNASPPAELKVNVPAQPLSEEIVELERPARKHKLVQVKGWYIGNLSNGLWAAYDDVDLRRDQPFNRVALRYAAPAARAGTEIDLFHNAVVEGYEERPGKNRDAVVDGQVKGTLLGTFKLADTGGFGQMKEVVIPVSIPESDQHTLVLRVRRGQAKAGNALGELDKLRFFRAAAEEH
jgi:hypothetical protein